MTIKTHIVAGEGNRCFTCGTRCNEDALVITDYEEVDEDDVYFCGNCVYYNTKIGRPCSNWISKLEIEQEEKRKKRAEAKAKREHEKWLKQFCCRKWGEFIRQGYSFNSISIYSKGTLFFSDYSYYDDYEPRNTDDTDEYNFTYCPYCRKKFIRDNK